MPVGTVPNASVVGGGAVAAEAEAMGIIVATVTAASKIRRIMRSFCVMDGPFWPSHAMSYDEPICDHRFLTRCSRSPAEPALRLVESLVSAREHPVIACTHPAIGPTTQPC